MNINTAKIMDRIEQISPGFGSQYGPVFIQQKGDKTTVYFISNHADGRNALWKDRARSPSKPSKTDKINGTKWRVPISRSDGKLIRSSMATSSN